MVNNSTLKIWCLFPYYVVILKYKLTAELSEVVLLGFLDGKSVEGFLNRTRIVKKADACWLNRDYEVLWANVLIVFVTAESNDRENGGRERLMLSVLNNDSVWQEKAFWYYDGMAVS